MKRILHLLVLLIIALCFMPAAYAESPVDRPVNTSRLDDIFARHGVNGTLVIYDVQKNGYWLHNAGRAAERFYPASTFKIFNSLIGLSEGVVKDADEVFYRYSGEPVYLESWKADASLRSAIKLSQVPAYKELARRIGTERMQANMKKLHYGNESIGSKIDSFWLEGPLKISALEQVKLLTALARRQLPYPQKAQQQVCDITVFKTDRCLHAARQNRLGSGQYKTPVAGLLAGPKPKTTCMFLP